MTLRRDVRAGNRSLHRGFTLVELLVVLTITSVLASIALPLVELTKKRQQEEQLRTRLRDIRDAIDNYKQAVDEGRILRKSDESGYPRSLEDLVLGVPDLRSPDRRKIYFLRRIPKDPFAADRKDVGTQGWGLRSYLSSAANPKAGKDVYDIFSTSNQIGLNGIAYAQW